MGFKTIIKDKRGVQMKNALFAVVVVSIVILATGVIMGEWNGAYNSGITYDLEDLQDVEGMADTSYDYSQRISPTDDDTGKGDFEGKMFRGGYGILGTIFSPFTPTINIIKSVGARFGIPTYLIKGIISLVLISLTIMVIAIIFRRVNA